MDFTIEDISEAEIARRRAVVEPLTDTVRDLIDAVIRTEVDDDTIAEAQRRIAEVVADLRVEQLPGSYGIRHTTTGIGMPWGNATVGVRNAIAPPLRTRTTDDGRVIADVVLGAAYEGPPGLMHGGVAALLLDQVMGEAAAVETNEPTFTGTLTFRYLRPSRLGPLHITARLVASEGRKRIVHGAVRDDEGDTVTAEGVFIVPRGWDGAVFRNPPA